MTDFKSPASTKGSGNKPAEELKDQAKKSAEVAKKKAGEAAEQAKAKARSFADDKKEEAAGQVGGFASALRTTADSLDSEDQASMAGYARQAASSLDRVSDALSNRNVDDLLETAEDLVRRQPVAFIGGALLAGFVLTRFAKASSERRHDQRQNQNQAYSSYQRDEATLRPAAGGHARPVIGTSKQKIN